MSTPADTFTDRAGATDEEFRARVAVFDAAEEPEEVIVEKLRTTIAVLRGELARSIRANGVWRSKLEAVEALADEIDARPGWGGPNSAARIRRALASEVRTSYPTAGLAFGSPEYLAALAVLDANPTPGPVAHNHTRVRNAVAGPWSPCPVSCPAAGLLR